MPKGCQPFQSTPADFPERYGCGVADEIRKVMRDTETPVENITWLGLDAGGLIAHLRKALNENRRQPSDDILRRFIETAFYASLEREEGRPLTFALMLIEMDVLRASHVNRKDWSPLVLSKPIALDV